MMWKYPVKKITFKVWYKQSVILLSNNQCTFLLCLNLLSSMATKALLPPILMARRLSRRLIALLYEALLSSSLLRCCCHIHHPLSCLLVFFLTPELNYWKNKETVFEMERIIIRCVISFAFPQQFPSCQH